MNLPEPNVHGSANPSIAFCLTLKTESQDLIPAVLSFVKETQDHAPIFMDASGITERLRCETIIRTDIDRGSSRSGFADNWMRVFNPGGKSTGINDFYIFEYLNCPWGSRSMVECVLLDPTNLGQSPLELSYAIKTALVEGKLDDSYAGWQIVIHPDPIVTAMYKARAEQGQFLPSEMPLESSEVPDLVDHELCHQ